jgi:large subunit ribosomal protein L15
MNLAEAKSLGLKFPERKRIGRGVGSGLGKTSGRGHKGAKARSGWSRRIGWEGGQMPLYRRLPKRGFNNKNFEKVFTVVNVGDLEVFETGSKVNLQVVLERGLTSKEKHSELFKILGDGKLTKALAVTVDAITAPARAKIEAVGGSVTLVASRGRRDKFVAKDGTKRQPGSPRIRRTKPSAK